MGYPRSGGGEGSKGCCQDHGKGYVSGADRNPYTIVVVRGRGHCTIGSLYQSDYVSGADRNPYTIVFLRGRSH